MNAFDAPGSGPSVAFKMHLGNGRTGHGKARKGPAPKPEPRPACRIPRVARLLALAHHFDDMIREGVVRDQAEVARLMKVTRARVTQIMNLLYLAPDVQEELLFSLAESSRGGLLSERRLRALALEPDWRRQRRAWASITGRPDEPGIRDGTPPGGSDLAVAAEMAAPEAVPARNPA